MSSIGPPAADLSKNADMVGKVDTIREAERLQAAAGLLRAGKAAEALALASELLQSPQRSYLEALCCSALGRVDEADRRFVAALEGAEKPGEVLANHANLMLRAGQNDRALVLYERATAEPTAPSAAFVAFGRALLLAQRSGDAVSVLEDFLKTHGANTEGWVVLGKALVAEERFEEARAAYDQALALDPRFLDGLMSRAHLSRISGDKTGAWQDLSQALQGEMGNPAVVLASARQLAMDGEVESARGAYERFLVLAPGRQDIHGEYNRFLWEVGRTEDYLKSYDRVIPRLTGPHKVSMLAEAGALAARANQLGRAQTFFEEILLIDPSHAGALVGLADLMKADAAEAAWGRAMDQAGNHPDVRLAYAWFLLNQNEPLRAEEVLQQTVAPTSQQQQLWYAYDSTAAKMLGRDRYQEQYGLDQVVGLREFRPPAQYGNLRSFLEAIEEALDPLYTRRCAPVDQSLFGGQQTAGSLWDTADPVLLDLKRVMLSLAEEFWSTLNVPPAHPIFREAKTALRYGGAWSVRLTSGGGHKDHVHTAGLLSSACYIAVPQLDEADPSPHAGNLRLGRPNLDRIDLPADRFIKPEPGLMVLFPSYVWHGVQPFNAKSRRITTPADFII